MGALGLGMHARVGPSGAMEAEALLEHLPERLSTTCCTLGVSACNCQPP